MLADPDDYPTHEHSVSTDGAIRRTSVNRVQRRRQAKHVKRVHHEEQAMLVRKEGRVVIKGHATGLGKVLVDKFYIRQAKRHIAAREAAEAESRGE